MSINVVNSLRWTVQEVSICQRYFYNSLDSNNIDAKSKWSLIGIIQRMRDDNQNEF